MKDSELKEAAMTDSAPGQKDAQDSPLHEAVFDALDASLRREIDRNVATVFMEAILLLWFCWQPQQIPTRHEDGRLTWREKDRDGQKRSEQTRRAADSVVDGTEK